MQIQWRVTSLPLLLLPPPISPFVFDCRSLSFHFISPIYILFFTLRFQGVFTVSSSVLEL
jgi:hypothetical protein